MTPFKSYRFGNVDVFQAGAWGTATRWEFKRDGSNVGARTDSEHQAVRLGYALSLLTDSQWDEARNKALDLTFYAEAAE